VLVGGGVFSSAPLPRRVILNALLCSAIDVDRIAIWVGPDVVLIEQRGRLPDQSGLAR